jgi:hypothetical protein
MVKDLFPPGTIRCVVCGGGMESVLVRLGSGGRDGTIRARRALTRSSYLKIAIGKITAPRSSTVTSIFRSWRSVFLRFFSRCRIPAGTADCAVP